MAETKDRKTHKFENVHNFIKCTSQHINSMLQYEIYSPFTHK